MFYDSSEGGVSDRNAFIKASGKSLISLSPIWIWVWKLKTLCGTFAVGMMAVTSGCKDAANKMGSVDNGKYVRYTPEQVEALERLYYECPKPSSMRRQQLIRECPILSNIEPKQIKVWFQNRR